MTWKTPAGLGRGWISGFPKAKGSRALIRKGSYPAAKRLSSRPTFTSARVDRAGPPAIFRRLRAVAPQGRPDEGPCGGTGRRARLKIEFRKECWFDSGQGHQIENINNNNDLGRSSRFRLSEKFWRRIENTSKNPPQPSILLAFLLVSGNQTLGTNSDIPKEETEQIARKNHGTSDNPNTCLPELL